MVGPVKPFNPNPGQKPNLRPGLQVPSTVDPELQNFLGVMAEFIEQHEGNRGQPKNRFVTIQELEDAGLISSVVKNRRAEIGSDAETGKATSAQGGTTQAALAITTELGDLQDVDTTGKKQGDVIHYNASVNKWQRTPAAGIPAGTLNNDLLYFSTAGGTPRWLPTAGNLTWDGANLCVEGTIDLNQEATATSLPGVKIDINAGGFGSIAAQSIAYFSGIQVLGQDDAVILIDIDQKTATGGNVAGLHVLSTDGSLTELPGLQAGTLVDPVLQLSGTFGNAATILVNAVDETVDLSSGGAGLVTVFVDQDDTMTIGSATMFQEMGFIYQGPTTGGGPFLSSTGIEPLFEYSTGVGTWATFRPIDGTNGMRNSGVIAWLDADIPGWAVGTGAEFLIRITRQIQYPDVATFVLNQVEISTNDLYGWDRDAVVSVDTVGFHSSGSTNDATIRHDGVNWIFTNTVGLTIFNGDVQFNDDIHLPDGVSIFFGTDDDASIVHDGADWFLTNTTGDTTIQGQDLVTINGGVGPTDRLELSGSTDADLGVVSINSHIEIDVDFSVTPLADIIRWDTVIASSGAAVSGFMNAAPDITIDSSVFIPSTVRDSGIYRQTVAPGFAVHTLFLGQPILHTSTASVRPNQVFMYAAQPRMRNQNAGNLNAFFVPNVLGLSFVPIMDTSGAAGDTLGVTNMTGVRVAPVHNTIAGTTINYGTIRGMHLANPTVVLFGSQAGTELMTRYVGLDMDNITFGGASNFVSVVRSSLASGTNRRFLENLSTAASTFGTSVVHHSDSGVIQFGGALNAADVSLFWNAGLSAFETFFWSTSDYLLTSSPDADRFLFNNVGGSATGEYNFNCHQFSLGAQTSAVGNQIGIFVAPAHTVTLAGEFSQYLLSQGGNLNLGVLAMSEVNAWKINSPSFDSSAYTLSELSTLRVAGMTTSNPGGTVTERAALWVRGRHMQEGSVQYEPINPAALSAGNNNDWAGLLTGSPSNNTRYWARVTGNATTSVLTGIDSTAVQDGDTFELTNVGSEGIDITNEDAASSAANRIVTMNGGTYLFDADETIQLRYDATDSRWRQTSGTIPTAGLLSGEYRFSTSTAAADPGSGRLRYNNATPASVTAVYVDQFTANGFDAQNILAALASGDQIYIQNEKDADDFLLMDITSVVDNTGWFTINGTIGASGALPANNASLTVTLRFA